MPCSRFLSDYDSFLTLIDFFKLHFQFEYLFRVITNDISLFRHFTLYCEIRSEVNEGNICLSELLYFDFNEERKNVDLLELNLHQLKNYSKTTQNLEKFEIIKISKIQKNFCSKILNSKLFNCSHLRDPQ